MAEPSAAADCMRPYTVTALIMTILAPVLWSTGGVCIRLLEISPWKILFYRTLLMAMTIMLWSVIRNRNTLNRRMTTANLIRSLPVSIFICISLCFYVLSMKNTGIADSLLIQGTAPLFIIIIGRMYLKDPLNRKTVAALAGITGGFLFIFLPALSESRLSGNIYGLIKAVAFALNVIAIRKLKDVDKIPATAIAAVMACVIAAGLTDTFTLSRQEVIVLLYFGIVQTGIAFILFTSWSGQIPSTLTGMIVLLESVLGPLWVWIFFDEVPPVFTLIGGGLIILSIIYNSGQQRPGRGYHAAGGDSGNMGINK